MVDFEKREMSSEGLGFARGFVLRRSIRSRLLGAARLLAPVPCSLSPRRCARRAITLIEILISMFVLLFGLMGVAAIFPVGNHYVQQGQNFDVGEQLAQNAFEEMTARGMLRPDLWLYADYPVPSDTTIPPVLGRRVVGPAGNFLLPEAGHVFVLDSLGGANVSVLPAERTHFPWNAQGLQGNPWEGDLPTGMQWPVRRATLPIPTGTMTTPVAETIFRLRDDLSVEQPDEGDVPSIQRWDVDAATNTLLRRQYRGDYSWLATIVPTNGEALAALQPANDAYGEIRYDVSVVVFRKRDFVPSAESERLIEAELLPGGEVILYGDPTAAPEVARAEVDNALDDVRTGNWISLMGVNQVTGDFVMKWYRLLSLDTREETGEILLPSTGNNVIGRRAMLIGPDWPATPGAAQVADLRAAILPGAVSVVTKQLKMEATSLWSLE